VNGRNVLTWREKFSLDLWYVDHWSLSFDARILLRTLCVVVRRGSDFQQGDAIMAEFSGREGNEP
jgi:sugar transferase EpsL